MFNASGDTSACKEMLLKPFGWQWIHGLKLWRHDAGNDQLLQRMRHVADRDGVELMVVDRGSRPSATVSMTQILRQQGMSERALGCSNQASLGLAGLQELVQAPSQSTYAGTLSRTSYCADAQTPRCPSTLASAPQGDYAVLDAALTHVDVDSLICHSSSTQSMSQGSTPQGSTSRGLSATPGPAAGTLPDATTTAAAPLQETASRQLGLSAEQRHRMEANKQRALALRAQRQVQQTRA